MRQFGDYTSYIPTCRLSAHCAARVQCRNRVGVVFELPQDRSVCAHGQRTRPPSPSPTPPAARRVTPPLLPAPRTPTPRAPTWCR